MKIHLCPLRDTYVIIPCTVIEAFLSRRIEAVVVKVDRPPSGIEAALWALWGMANALDFTSSNQHVS